MQIVLRFSLLCLFFFFNDTATTEIYTLSLHDALPISCCRWSWLAGAGRPGLRRQQEIGKHTSELQSHSDLVCRLLLEKKKKNPTYSSPLKPKNNHRYPHQPIEDCTN